MYLSDRKEFKYCHREMTVRLNVKNNTMKIQREKRVTVD
jgi:hypothetical protein